MTAFDDLSDNEWALIEGLFFMESMPPARAGRPRADTRTVVNAVLWALSTGRGWASLPGWYPSRPTCCRRFDEWQADGTLAEMLRRLAAGGRHVPLRGPIGAVLMQARARAEQQRVNGLTWSGPQTWRAPLEIA
ncbi:transposase [Paraburkholderia sp. DHOC27]|uniref:transposase n=1 Tax=Paraburkholderia sp. DHOC27 TaxID=2303330 RepID=UPI0015F2F19E|nr:transposase [Paraburkholderia sp. DHOC27]